jgi:hypothetical protein
VSETDTSVWDEIATMEQGLNELHEELGPHTHLAPPVLLFPRWIKTSTTSKEEG